VPQTITEISGGESEMVFELLAEEDPKRRCPQIARARDDQGCASVGDRSLRWRIMGGAPSKGCSALLHLGTENSY
jgi:hypothetical protein